MEVRITCAANGRAVQSLNEQLQKSAIFEWSRHQVNDEDVYA